MSKKESNPPPSGLRPAPPPAPTGILTDNSAVIRALEKRVEELEGRLKAIYEAWNYEGDGPDPMYGVMNVTERKYWEMEGRPNVKVKTLNLQLIQQWLKTPQKRGRPTCPCGYDNGSYSIGAHRRICPVWADYIELNLEGLLK